MAYRLTDWLSLGAGLSIVYATMTYEAKLTSLTTAATVKVDEADDWAVGGTFGILLEPRTDTRIGIVYRTPVDLKLKGDFEAPIVTDVGIDVEFKYERTGAKIRNAYIRMLDNHIRMLHTDLVDMHDALEARFNQRG